MTKRSFREHHLLQLFYLYEEKKKPIDALLNEYFRQHKALGSKDRAYIAENTFGMIRWKALLDYIIGSAPTWEKRLQAFQNFDPLSYQKDTTIPLHIRVSCPKHLFEYISATHGEQKAAKICFDSNFQAPTAVRVNTLKTNREELMELWSEQDIFPTDRAPNGIVFRQKIQFTSFPEFKKGFFEMQDEGSQIVGELVKVQPGQSVLDYCAGGGGKTLAFAPFMHNTGQIYLHDIRSHALYEAKQRLKRAGIQNAQIIHPESPHLKNLKKKMDWVLVDAPCSGTGTLRRNPDMKWKFTSEMLLRLVGQQRSIFEKALSFLKPNGKIIYATCSILDEENNQQTQHFLNTYPLEIAGEPFVSIPQEGMMDGFYACTFSLLQNKD